MSIDHLLDNGDIYIVQIRKDMPINTSMLRSMQKEYGKKKGQQVYFASENKGGKSFQKGMRTAKKEGHTVAHLKDLKKKK